MGITKENLETMTKLLSALAQRHVTIQDLATQLLAGTAWRSTDGSLKVELTDAQVQEIEEFIRTYVQEAETITLALKAHLGPAGPEKP